MVKIKTVAKTVPEHSRSTAEILPFLDGWLDGHVTQRFIRKVKKIFENAAVDKRVPMLSPADVFAPTTFEERNDIYIKESIKLGTRCLSDALKKANWSATQIDYLITVSCTGIMIPSIDAYLVNNLKM